MEWNVLWEIIKEVFSVIGDIALFIIAVYTFYFTFFPQLRLFGITQKRDFFNGDSISVSFENRGLYPVCITSVEAVSDEYKVTIFSKKDDDNGCIIEGFKSSTIEMQPFSVIQTQRGELDLTQIKVKYLIVKTLRRTFYIDLNKRKHTWKTKLQNKIHPPKETFLFHETYNGLTITPHIKYAVSFVDASQMIQTILVMGSGFMSRNSLGFNVIPEEYVKSKKALERFLKENYSDIEFVVEEMNKTTGIEKQ